MIKSEHFGSLKNVSIPLTSFIKLTRLFPCCQVWCPSQLQKNQNSVTKNVRLQLDLIFKCFVNKNYFETFHKQNYPHYTKVRNIEAKNISSQQFLMVLCGDYFWLRFCSHFFIFFCTFPWVISIINQGFIFRSRTLKVRVLEWVVGWKACLELLLKWILNC